MITKDKPAKYLDAILKNLAENFNTGLNVQEIQNRLTPMEIFGQRGDVTFMGEEIFELSDAIRYLQSQELVATNLANDKIKITFDGYIKIKTRSFSKEIKEKSVNQTLQRLAWVLPIIISCIALIISIMNSNSTSITIKYDPKKASQPLIKPNKTCRSLILIPVSANHK